MRRSTSLLLHKKLLTESKQKIQTPPLATSDVWLVFCMQHEYLPIFACIIVFRTIPDTPVRVRCYTRAFQTDLGPEETQKSLWFQRWDWKCRSVKMKNWNMWIKRFSEQYSQLKFLEKSIFQLPLEYVITTIHLEKLKEQTCNRKNLNETKQINLLICQTPFSFSHLEG